MLRPTVYQLSRGIYRKVAPLLVDDGDRAAALRACEQTIARLVTDRHYFAHPTRQLFGELRWRVGLTDQRELLATIDRHLQSIATLLRTDPDAVLHLTGNRDRCRATTRRADRCSSPPDPRTGYCWHHRHLVEGFGGV